MCDVDVGDVMCVMCDQTEAESVRNKCLLLAPACARLRDGDELLRLTNRCKAVPHVDARFTHGEPVLDALLTGLVNFVDTRAEDSLAIRDVLGANEGRYLMSARVFAFMTTACLVRLAAGASCWSRTLTTIGHELIRPC